MRQGTGRAAMLSPRTRKAWAGVAFLLALGLCVVPAPARADGVTVALVPTATTVAPGTEFDIYLQCTQPGTPFNGFDTVVGWDPAALAFIRLSPVSLQEGSYMKGACGNTFHRFHMGASTDTITEVLLCEATSLPGPGQLYRLHFKAADKPQTTAVEVLHIQFYDAGMYVGPAHVTNAVLGIGMPAPVGVEGQPASKLALRAAPNPARGGMSLAVDSDRAGPQRITLRDLQGRTVRLLGEAWAPAGRRSVVWDGRDGAGGKLPPGIYLATVEVASRSTTCRVTLLP